MTAGLPLDLRLSLRSLRRSPGFSAAAVLTLALGIGAAILIFGVLEAVLLRPWIYPRAERVVVPASLRIATQDRWSVCYGDFLDWQKEGIFDGVAVHRAADLDLSSGGNPVRVTTALVGPDFFRVLGVEPAIGRIFRDGEFVPGADRAIILSDPLWRSAFGGARDVVGREIRLAGLVFTVAGIMPPGFAWPSDAAAWLPLRLGPPTDDLLRRDNFIFGAIARLRDDSGLEPTRARLASFARRIEQELPGARAGITVTAVPLAEWVVGPEVRRALWTLLAGVGFVLLIGCMNVANLLLARGTARRRELAVLAALGARRRQIMRPLLFESLILAIAGGALGLILAVWGMGAVAALAPADVPRLADLALNPVVALFAVLLSLLAALLSGIVPALQISALRPVQAFDEGGREGTSSPRAKGLRDILVASELALSLILLAGTGLMLRSLSRLARVEPGVDLEHVITASLTLPDKRYPTDESQVAFYETLTERLREVHGVQAAGAASALPLGGGGFYLGRAFLAEGRPEPPAGSEVNGMWNVVTPGYFGAAGMRVQRGRDFTPRDDARSTPVAVVNEAFARAMFPGEEPLGRRVRSWRDENVLREIVGVVGDVRYFGVGDEIRPLFYVPYRQDPWSSMTVTVRAAGGPPGALAAPLRSVLQALDGDLAAGSLQTMEQIRATSIAQPRFNTVLLSLFAALALLLAAVGLYGVMSYSVALRTREIGLRMALGARAADVLRLVLRRTVVLLGAGIAAGIAGALGVTRLMAGLLYEVGPGDPAAFLGGTLLLAAVALLAGWLPARRATRVDPMTALRSE
jgi:putative ABC transport system permease protein